MKIMKKEKEFLKKIAEEKTLSLWEIENQLSIDIFLEKQAYKSKEFKFFKCSLFSINFVVLIMSIL